mgnify:CR=1 FL=1
MKLPIRDPHPIDSREAERLEIKLAQAQEAETHRREIERLAAEAATQRSFASAIEQWEKLELSRRKDAGQESMRALRKDVLPVLGDIALVEVKRSMLLGILDDVVTRGARVMANHLFSDLRQFYNFAIAREWVEAHPLAGLKKEQIGGRQKERDRYLSEEEIIELNDGLSTANLLHTTELAIWVMLADLLPGRGTLASPMGPCRSGTWAVVYSERQQQECEGSHSLSLRLRPL